MTRIFLSYASEDETAASALLDRFGEANEFFWWRDRAFRGSRFVGTIEEGIANAERFLVLLSPAYLTSPWCRYEREIATELAIRRGRPFIHVLQVDDVDYADAGALNIYDRFDVRVKPDGSDRFADVTVLDGAAPPVRPADTDTARDTGQRVRPTPAFRNREAELTRMLRELRTPGGDDLWVVDAPPRLGKSWLLDRVQHELVEGTPQYAVRQVDLRDHPETLRRDPVALIEALLGIELGAVPDGPWPESVLRQAAIQLAERGGHQLYALDSADLILTSDCTKRTRYALSGIHHLVSTAVTADLRVAFVVGTRRPQDWKGQGQSPGRPFTPLHLIEFRTNVIAMALQDMQLDMDRGRRQEVADALHRLSEGLPAVLTHSLSWVVHTGLIEKHLIETDRVFDEVALPYVQNDLLSCESLFPSGHERLTEATDALCAALEVLAPYRLFTMSHIRFHLERDSGFGNKVAAAGWTDRDLWAALGRTSLCVPEVGRPWQKIEPSLRRLLHRHFHRTTDRRREVHTAATACYRRWTSRRAAGLEQNVLIECIWHEASRLMITEPEEHFPDVLVPVIADLAREYADLSYEPEEFGSSVMTLLDHDAELQSLLSHHVGLYERVGAVMRDSIIEGDS